MSEFVKVSEVYLVKDNEKFVGIEIGWSDAVLNAQGAASVLARSKLMHRLTKAQRRLTTKLLAVMNPSSEWTLAQIGEAVGCDLSSVSRHFRKLEHVRVVERCGKQRWRLGVSAETYKRSLCDETYSKTEDGSAGHAAARANDGVGCGGAA
jgi:predicted transcriptional regulator